LDYVQGRVRAVVIVCCTICVQTQRKSHAWAASGSAGSSLHAHTRHSETNHILDPHPVHRRADHLFGNVGDVLWAIELHIVRIKEGREVGQCILDGSVASL
jgi:hypothetical protein